MFFHFTTQYGSLFGHRSVPIVSFPWGHYGVNLFFMISGFVIFLTLHRIRRPADFLVSRFSRLYPAFWVAVILTFLLTHLFELPGKTVDVGTALANLLMFHGWFKVPHVDNVYWTLEIELTFYFWAIVLYCLRLLDRAHSALLLLLALRLIYFLAEQLYGVSLPYTLSRILILPYIAWFGCGIMLYRLACLPEQSPRLDLLLLAASIGVLGVVDGFGIGLLALGLSAIFHAATQSRIPWLAHPMLVWLGSISYTLYLIHENIGWGVIYQAQRAGIDANLSIVLAIVCALALATTLTRLVEVPAMKWLRERYRRHAAGLIVTRAGS